MEYNNGRGQFAYYQSIEGVGGIAWFYILKWGLNLTP